MALWHNIAEMMDYYIPSLPSVYWIDITRICNLRCIMCPQSRGLQRRRANMPMAMFRGIIDDICENRPLVKLYMSGEPLLHGDLFDMIDHAAARGCRTMVHTNATLLTKALSEKIMASSLDFLTFSFDGCTPEVYEKLRPPARFERVRSNIRLYLDLRARNGGGGPRTTVEIIRMRETQEHLRHFVDEWRDSGVDDVHVTDYLTWHGSVEDRRVEDESDGEAYKPCAAPFRHGCILSDGTVVPCCLDVNGRMPLGQIPEQTFRDIWVSHSHRQLRLQLLSGTVSPGCLCDGCANTFRDA